MSGESRIQAAQRWAPHPLVIHAPDRGDAVLGHVTSLAAGPFGPEEISRVLRTVMAETRRAEERK